MHRFRVLIIVMTVVVAAMTVLATDAAAHITVSAPGATRGGNDQEITFRVPVEKQSDTIALTVALPTDTPIASVLVDPMPGWSHTEKTVKLAKPIVTDDGDISTAVSEITWTADAGQGLKPGEYGSFTILAGMLPDASSLTFRALQKYADGSVVRWNEVAAPGSKDEPNNPAPVLDLAATTTTPSAPATTTDSGSDTVPVVLSIVALVVAVGAVGLALVGRSRQRAGST
jgi:periplasmic copper chaperone A